MTEHYVKLRVRTLKIHGQCRLFPRFCSEKSDKLNLEKMKFTGNIKFVCNLDKFCIKKLKHWGALVAVAMVCHTEKLKMESLLINYVI